MKTLVLACVAAVLVATGCDAVLGVTPGILDPDAGAAPSDDPATELRPAPVDASIHADSAPDGAPDGAVCKASAPTLCGATCTDLKSDPQHCGSCTTACAAADGGAPACIGGACTVACGKDSHACAGACVSSTSPSTCGTACTPCATPPNTVATCDGVKCGWKCAVGFGDCDKKPANGCEKNLEIDEANCGVCGNACPTLVACGQGLCNGF